MVKLSKIDLNKQEFVQPQIDLNKQSGFNLQKKPVNGVAPKPPFNIQFPEFTEANEGLVPVGDTGLFITPTEPISPTDCDNWPDSPYCGGNPLSPHLLDLGFEIVLDPCNVGISFSPALGFIKLPQFQVVYKDLSNPNCQPKPVKPPLTDFPPLNLPGIDPNAVVVVFVSTEEVLRKGFIYKDDVEDSYEFKITQKFEWLQTQMPGRTVDDVTTLASGRARASESGQGYVLEGDTPVFQSDSKSSEDWIDYRGTAFGGYLLIVENWGTIQQILTKTHERFNIASFDESEHVYTYTISSLEISISDVYDLQGNPIPFYPLPPLPPETPCCMGCCPNTNQNNDALLALLLEKVEKLSEVVGVDEYPASVPESLIAKDEGWLGNLIPNPNIKIPSLTRLFGWFVERFDEVMGQFEIPIEIKDTDPTTPGDQPKGFKLPNIAESIGELCGLALHSVQNSELLLNITTKLLVEAGQDKQQNFKSYMLLDTIAEYLGFAQKERKLKLPLTFTPGKEGYDQLLKETEIEVAVPEFADKIDLQDHLAEFRKASAIVKAAHWRKLDHNNMAAQIMDIIKGYAKTGDKVSNQEKDADGKDDFDRFIDDAQVGFTNQPGITDTEHPYGASYAERPKITKIGTDTSDMD